MKNWEWGVRKERPLGELKEGEVDFSRGFWERRLPEEGMSELTSLQVCLVKQRRSSIPERQELEGIGWMCSKAEKWAGVGQSPPRSPVGVSQILPARVLLASFRAKD